MFRHPDRSAGAENLHQLSATSASPPFSQSQFVSPAYYIDPSLHNSPQQPRPRGPGKPASHARQSSAELPRSVPPLASGSPQMSSTTSEPSRPSDRSLPPTDVTAETITDAFVCFILYCNPNFELDVDTATLTTAFHNPPKSDNKDFETFRLFQLIKKLDAKEIKTWGQLALDLGVEPPNTAKGQSVQKVQQYSVRLKRWMHAMHIDAFFEYLIGKQHSYFTHIPHPSDPFPSEGRDGVIAEEDLAIRALDPSFRPKRGRRRNSEVDESAESESATRQQRMLESAAPFSGAPTSGIPMSAHPDNFTDPWAVASAVTPQTFAPWSAKPSASMAPSLGRWQLNHSQTPSTPHPISAIPTSMSAHIDAEFDGEPRSAVTPSSRKRRRHGPAVSSAWPSTSAPGSKPRGRPPANRNTQDGPFSTFPVGPANEKPKLQTSALSQTHVDDRPSPSIEHASPQTASPAIMTPQMEGRPHRLSLQVPPHKGGPVRLATPPTLLVNGEMNDTGTKSDSDEPSRNPVANVTSAPQGKHLVSSQANSNSTSNIRLPTPGISFEALKRAVASDLLRANVTGRRQRLTGDEAKRLADAVLDRLAVTRPDTTDPRDAIARFSTASWLGVGSQLNLPLASSTGHSKNIAVTRFRTDADGYEEITTDESSTEGVREIFDLSWTLSQGGCMGRFEIRSLSLGLPAAPHEAGESLHDLILRKGVEATYSMDADGWLEQSMREIARSAQREPRGREENIDWKAKYKVLEFSARIAKGEMERMQQRLIEKVVDAALSTQMNSSGGHGSL